MVTKMVASAALILLAVNVAWAEDKPTPGKAPSGESSVTIKSRAMRDKLATSVTFDKPILADTRLEEVIQFLMDHFDLTVILDASAFKEDLQVAAIQEEKVGMPRLRDIRLGSFLRMLTAQIGATYVVLPDHILITTPQRTRPEEWTRDHRDLAPTVNVDFEKRPLGEALRELASLTGINIVLDDRVEGNKVPVTATLTNAPVDTAVRLLADMADLHAVVVDGVLYVTPGGTLPSSNRSQAALKVRTSGHWQCRKRRTEACHRVRTSNRGGGGYACCRA